MANSAWKEVHECDNIVQFEINIYRGCPSGGTSKNEEKQLAELRKMQWYILEVDPAS
jgi:hypothetical protein